MKNTSLKDFSSLITQRLKELDSTALFNLNQELDEINDTLNTWKTSIEKSELNSSVPYFNLIKDLIQDFKIEVSYIDEVFSNVQTIQNITTIQKTHPMIKECVYRIKLKNMELSTIRIKNNLVANLSEVFYNDQSIINESLNNLDASINTFIRNELEDKLSNLFFDIFNTNTYVFLKYAVLNILEDIKEEGGLFDDSVLVCLNKEGMIQLDKVFLDKNKNTFNLSNLHFLDSILNKDSIFCLILNKKEQSAFSLIDTKKIIKLTLDNLMHLDYASYKNQIKQDFKKYLPQNNFLIKDFYLDKNALEVLNILQDIKLSINLALKDEKMAGLDSVNVINYSKISDFIDAMREYKKTTNKEDEESEENKETEENDNSSSPYSYRAKFHKQIADLLNNTSYGYYENINSLVDDDDLFKYVPKLILSSKYALSDLMKTYFKQKETIYIGNNRDNISSLKENEFKKTLSVFANKFYQNTFTSYHLDYHSKQTDAIFEIDIWCFKNDLNQSFLKLEVSNDLNKTITNQNNDSSIDLDLNEKLHLFGVLYNTIAKDSYILFALNDFLMGKITEDLFHKILNKSIQNALNDYNKNGYLNFDFSTDKNNEDNINNKTNNEKNLLFKNPFKKKV